MLVLWPWADARTWGLLHGERLLLDKVSSHRWKKQNGGTAHKDTGAGHLAEAVAEGFSVCILY